MSENNTLLLEESIVGCLMLYPDSLQVIESIIDCECFSSKPLRTIYRSIVAVINRQNWEVFVFAVEQELLKNGDEHRQQFRLACDCMARTVSPLNVDRYAIALAKQREARVIQFKAIELSEFLDQPGLDIEDVRLKLEESFSNIPQAIDREKGKTLVECFEDFENKFNHPSRAISTGLSDFDAVTGGFHPQDLIILAGRPSMGKSLVAGHFALATARQNKEVLFFSAEMDRVQLFERFISTVS